MIYSSYMSTLMSNNNSFQAFAFLSFLTCTTGLSIAPPKLMAPISSSEKGVRLKLDFT